MIVTTKLRRACSNNGMNTRHLMASLVAFALTASGGALADGIYKWTDADGNVHYGDRPSGAPTEERLHMSYNRTSAASVNRRVDAYRDATEARNKAKEEAAEAEAAAAEERAQADQRAAKCEQLRTQLRAMLDARRVYKEDANGERVYLDDDGREAARTKAEQQIQEFCS